MVGQDASSWRISLDVSVSRGLSGGHPETEGLTAGGQIMETVLHAHEVTLDLTRYELGLTRSFNENWDAFVRIPYFIKDQRATVVFPHGGSPEEREAAIRNGFAHHRTDVYEGFSDIELGAGWKKRGLLGDGSIFRFSLGVAIPTGATEPDPLVAGDLGLVHNHVQFGNGTFDPILDVYYGRPLNEKWAVSLYGKGRFPLYKNDHGYRGSIEGTFIPRISFLPNKRLSLSAGLAANYYDYTQWSGRRDPNSGQFSLNASLSAGYKFNEHLTGSLSVLLPLYTESFSGEDALDPAPTFALSAAWTF
jgi:hypothetical protein